VESACLSGSGKTQAFMEKAPQLGKLRGLKAALEVWVFGGGTAAEKVKVFCLRWITPAMP